MEEFYGYFTFENDNIMKME